MPVVVTVDNIGKQYTRGAINAITLREELDQYFFRLRHKVSPGKHPAKAGGKWGKAADKKFWAVEKVSFDVNEGEIIGIIGKNGAGKSTLLKILSRITAPSTGTVKMKGSFASLLEVGTGFHPELSGRENIYLNGAILGMNKQEIKTKFDEIVDFSGVEKFIDTPVKRYSSGMYVRLAFAVAAHLEPDILIVDEVLAVGDADFQNKALGKMSEVSSKTGRTVFFVSHNMGSILNISHKVLYLKNGQLQQLGTPGQVIDSYYNSEIINDRNLLDLNDHAGTGEVVVSRIELRDTNNTPVNLIQSGQDVTFCLRFHAHRKEFRNLTVGIQISTLTGIPLFLHNTRLTGTQFCEVPEFGEFIFRIKKFPLPPSKYLVSYTIMEHNEYLDAMEEVCEFNVEGNIFYENLNLSPSSQGLMLVDGSWSVQELSF